MSDAYAICSPGEEKELGTSDLRIASHQPITRVFVGGRVLVPFDFDFASTAATHPTFSFSPSSTLPGAILTPVTGSFVTGFAGLIHAISSSPYFASGMPMTSP